MPLIMLVMALFGVVGAAVGAGTLGAADPAARAGVVKVYLADTATVEEVNALRSDLESNDAAGCEVTFVSKDDALQEARELFEDSPDVLDNLPGNPFPAYLAADCTAPGEIDQDAYRGRPGVAEVKAD